MEQFRLLYLLCRPEYEAHSNNMHCLATAVNEVFGALFSMHSHFQADIEDRLKEFLALASSSLLRLVFFGSFKNFLCFFFPFPY
jgi:hypothetical protein